MQNSILKTLWLISSKKILLTSLLVSTFSFADDIGGIEEHKGSGGITRSGENITTELGLAIQQMDHVETAKGRMLLKFLDDSVVRLTEHTEVTLTEYYYDPNKKADANMTMKFVAGTARFSTGRLGLVPKENIKIETPTATIAVRGTDFTTSVDELGRSLVILLPETECTIDGDCSPSGEITVTNEGGVVTLSEAYQATMVSSFNTIPSQPVVLDNINLNMIDNMFIVSPPNEIEEKQDEGSNGTGNADNNILDFTDLDTDYLADDFLAEDNLEFNELDMDLLDVDFLQDILVALEKVSIFNRRSALDSSSGDIQGTLAPGFDKDTQYNTIIDQGAGQIWFYREVNGVISVKIPIGTNLTLDTENEGRKNNIIVGDGQSVIIIIRQGG
jgi:hypothetical protein|tara:strand:- start:406 stop:1569 length:1164 start_codon:yes stop_codon:yes gene_type:complete